MVKKEEYIKAVKEGMRNPEYVRNIGIIAHVHHGKTTLSDSLLAGAGLISEELAGEQLYLNYDEMEAERKLTVYSGFVTMVHEYQGQKYLVNLIDTPGHVDFSGEVTRALRAIDGVILVVDALEGVMAQTEMNLRQALIERCKPVLFINKTDRLISELKLPLEEIQKRIEKVIAKVNELIEKYAPEQFKNEWKVDVQSGKVAIGSAKNKWAISFPWMQKTGITFKKMYEMLMNDQLEELQKKCPVHEITLDMVVKHLPDPKKAQKYRIEKIWSGDVNSEIGKKMVECDPDAPLVGVVCQNRADKHAGMVSIARLFCGRATPGKTVYLISEGKETKIQQVAIYKGPDRIVIDEALGGNVVALIGLGKVSTGETISEVKDIAPFEEIKHYAEPVVTYAVDVEDPKQLVKLIEALKELQKEDNTIQVIIREDTGEYIIGCLGELHMDMIMHELKDKRGLRVKRSNPTIVYKETITKSFGPIEGKSPNKHNRFFIVVEPLEDKFKEAYESGLISDGAVTKKNEDKYRPYFEKKEDADGCIYVYKGNVLINATKGIQYFDEVKDYLIEGFKQAMDAGPLVKEPVTGVKVKIVDAVIHEDSVHRGLYQIVMATKPAIHEAMEKAGIVLLEPIKKIEIMTSMEYMSQLINELQRRRGRIENVEEEGDNIKIVAYLPVAESFNLANEIRSITAGRAVWYELFAGFQPVPREILDQVIKSIKSRKGLE